MTVFSRNRVVLLCLICLVLTYFPGCDGDSSNGSAESEPVATAVSPEEPKGLAYPSKEWECTEESAALVDAWFEAMNPYFQGPRAYLGGRSFGDRVLSKHGDLYEGWTAPVGSLRADHVLETDGPLFLVRDSADRRWDNQLLPIEFRRNLGARLSRTRAEYGEQNAEEPIAVGLLLEDELPMYKAATVLADLQHNGGDRHLVSRYVVLLETEDNLGQPEGVEPIDEAQRERAESLKRADFLDSEPGQLARPDGFNGAIAEAVEGCGAMEQVLGALDDKQGLEGLAHFAERAGTAWRECGCQADLEFLIAAVAERHLPPPVGSMELVLSPQGEPVTYTAEETWQEVVDRLQEFHNRPIYLQWVDEDGLAATTLTVEYEGLVIPAVIDGRPLDRERLVEPDRSPETVDEREEIFILGTVPDGSRSLLSDIKERDSVPSLDSELEERGGGDLD